MCNSFCQNYDEYLEKADILRLRLSDVASADWDNSDLFEPSEERNTYLRLLNEPSQIYYKYYLPMISLQQSI